MKRGLHEITRTGGGAVISARSAARPFVKAAGKKLNKKYVEALKTGLTQLRELADSIEGLLDDAGELDEEEIAAAATSNGQVQAGELIDRVNRVSWYDQLYATLRIFCYVFEEALADNKGIEVVQEALGEFVTIMKELATKYAEFFVVKAAGIAAARIDEGQLNFQPEDGQIQAGELTDRVNRVSWYERMYSVMRMFAYLFEEALWDNESMEVIDEMLTEFVVLMQELALDYNEVFVSASSAAILQARRGERPENFVQLEVGEIDLTQLSTGNSIPISGVLCTLDSPSEHIPAVGPGCRLLISSAVASKACAGICGTPLDAHESLKQHANDSIVGVMMSGCVQNSQLKIQGHLFPFNQPELVNEIRAKQRRLGMSMNAIAPGHYEDWEGEQVYVVDSLTLLGANILEANSATFSNTKISAQSKQTAGYHLSIDKPVRETRQGLSIDKTPAIQAAANSPTNSTQELSPMDPKELAAALSPLLAENNRQLLAEVKQEVNSMLSASNGELSAQVSALTANVNTLVDERNARIEAENKVIEQQAEQTRQEQLAAMIDQRTAQAVHRLINPTNSPSRLTTPLAAAASGQAANQAADPDLIELSRLEGQLETLTKFGASVSGAMAQRLELRNKINAIQLRRGIQPVNAI
jgi:hypothetical protein